MTLYSSRTQVLYHLDIDYFFTSKKYPIRLRLKKRYMAFFRMFLALTERKRTLILTSYVKLKTHFDKRV